MRNASVSVTGASGFLGSHIAEAFRDAGWCVRGIVRPGRGKALPAGIEPSVAPLDADLLTGVTAGSDVIVHAAAVTRAANETTFDEVNVAGTRAVVEAANRSKARLILISSQAVAGPATPARPAREDDVPRPLTAYARSKLAAERVVRESARGPWTILRPASVYGPRDRQFLPLVRLANRGQFWLAADPAAAFTLVFASDVARAVRMAAEDPRAVDASMFIGHPIPCTADDILRHLAEACGRVYRPRRVTAAILTAAAWAGELAWRVGTEPVIDRARLLELRAEGFVCAVERARNLIGFTATTPLAEGLDATVKWYRDRGSIRG